MMRPAIFAVVAAFAVLLVLSGCSSKPGEFDSLAQCLSEKGVIMYGTEWCPHCKDQKQLFGSSFEYINYVNCDLNRKACADAEVQGYPTWVINGESFAGTRALAELAARSGCAE